MALCSNGQLLSMIKKHDNVNAKILIEIDSLYNEIDRSSNTLLHYAVKYRNPEIAKYLVESGCDVDAQNEYGQTAAIRCFKCASPCCAVLEILLKAGASVHIEDVTGVSILDRVDNIEWLTQDISRFQILKTVLEYGNVVYLDCFTLLSGTRNVIKLLLDTNINLNKPDSEGKTVVHALASNPNPGVIELLRGRDYDVNASDNWKWTPLMYAVKNYIVNSVEFLIKEGADIEAMNKNGESALYIAFLNYDEQEGQATVQLLLEYRANVQIEVDDDDSETIFDMHYQDLPFLKLPLAYLALEEARGTTITDFVRERLDSYPELQAYFEECQNELSIEVCSSMKLFNLLTTSERNLERCLQNEELAAKLLNFGTPIEFYATILRKRFPRAIKMMGLRKQVVRTIGKVLQWEYDSYPFVIDEIASHLEEPDIAVLKIMEDECPD